MKKNLLIRLLIITVFVSTLSALGSCSVQVNRRTTVVRKSKPLPPGHAKKIYGDKSAKNYTKKRRR
ncbi:MAG: hypothetical protein V4666_09575 [Bacteroidota bacterium]